MRCFRANTLLFLLLLCGMRAFSQDSVVRIGVTNLRTGPNTISISDARDRLVKALNQQKPDKKFHFSVEAVALDAEWGPKAVAEAREKRCEFVLSTHLLDLKTSSVLTNNGAEGMDYLPSYSASVEYRLLRVADASGFAVGTIDVSDPSSTLAAALQALMRVPSSAIADIGKRGNVPHVEGPAAASSASKGADEVFSTRPCAWMPDNIPHADAVRGICEYAVSLPTRMPNFVCDQDASRFRGKNKVPFDLVTAAVRYEDGKESYENIKVNGKPVPDSVAKSAGLWSTGEFGSNLSAVFDPWNAPLFAFSKESKMGDRAVWVFTYLIAKQNDPLWRLHGENEMLAPPYKGELWVDQKTGGLVKFDSVAMDIPSTFSMASASLEIDYQDVAFADGSSFALPYDFTVTTAYRRQDSTRNVVQFRNCHKFRAKTQIVMTLPSAAAAGGAAPEDDSRIASRDDAAGDQIYAILREQAVRDDDAGINLEHKQELDAATVGALTKMAALEKERRRIAQQEAQIAEAAESTSPPNLSAPASESSTKIETTLRVTVKFVPVPVVLRDSNGKAVGNLSKEDFQLFDNGKPQPITHFSIEKSAMAPTAQEKSKEPGAAATAPAEQRAVPDRYVAYVFDDIHSVFENLAGARDAATRHLAALRPQDRAAIFTTSGQVGLNFTADRDQLKRALQQLRPHPIVRGALCPPVSHYMADLIVNQNDLEALGLATKDAVNCAFGGMATSRDDLARAEQIARQTAMEVLSANSAENQSVLSILREVFRRTAAAPGNRSIVLVSPGFLTLSPETRESIIDLIDNAVRSEIIVNTLDVRGLYTPTPPPNQAHPSDPVVRFRYDREEALDRSEVMATLAYSTGGTFFHNNNDMDEGFRKTADAPEYIYVLGFSPQKLDGKLHKLKVTLNNGSKLTIQAREGYYALKPASSP